MGDALDQEIVAAQAAVAEAIWQLGLDIVANSLSPTAATAAAVTALKQRVAAKEAYLATLYAEKAAQSPPPVNPIPSPTGAYGGTLGGIPKVPITGVVLGTSAAAAEGAWGTFLDETEGLVEINTSLNAIAASSLEAGTGIAITEVGGGIVAAIADLPWIAIAIGSVIICYLIGKILVLVGRHFPNPSIFGWHPLNFIQGGIEHVGQALVDIADGIMHPIIALLLTPIHLFKALFQRGANATASAHNKIAHVVTLTVPEARHDAVVTANSYTNEQIAKIDTGPLNTKITTISDTLDSVRKAQQLTTNELNNVTALGAVGITAVLATMAKVISDLKTKVDTCMVDRCNPTGPHGLKTELMALLAAVTDLAELGYVTAAIVDPVHDANAQAPGFEAIDAQAVNLLNTILSL